MLLLAALALAAVSSPPPPMRPGPEFFAAHRQRVLDKLPAGAIAVRRAASSTAGGVVHWKNVL